MIVNTYKLALPYSCEIHPVFHVSLHKAYKVPKPLVSTLSIGADLNQASLEPELILDMKIAKKLESSQ